MSTTDGSTVRTGHGGKVMCQQVDTGTYYLIARITQWSVSMARTEAAWADSDSAGYTNRVGGRRDITGSLTGKLDKEHPAYNDVLFSISTTDPNDNEMVQLLLWEDGNETSPNDYWYMPRALITSFDMSIDVDTKDPVEWSANFGADGIFYRPRESGNLQPTDLMVSGYRDLASSW